MALLHGMVQHAGQTLGHHQCRVDGCVGASWAAFVLHLLQRLVQPLEARAVALPRLVECGVVGIAGGANELDRSRV